MNELELQTHNISLIDSINIEEVASIMQKINRFQAVVQQTLKENHDYGVIPGVQKPTLLKPGGEKVCMMFGINPEYEFLSTQEDYKNEFFSYNIKCTLYKNGMPCAQGVGSCNSKEKKYRYINVDIPPSNYVGHSEQFSDKYGRIRYKIENNDTCSLVNTILKMAKKRAFIDAVLQVASLSEIFTQDVEDMKEFIKSEQSVAVGSMTAEQAGEIKLSFGKYKGATLREIFSQDKNYFSWLSINTKDEIIKKSCEIINAVVEKRKEEKRQGKQKHTETRIQDESMPENDDIALEYNDRMSEFAQGDTNPTI